MVLHKISRVQQKNYKVHQKAGQKNLHGLNRKVIIKIKLKYDTDIGIIGEFYITMINILKETTEVRKHELTGNFSKEMETIRKWKC